MPETIDLGHRENDALIRSNQAKEQFRRKRRRGAESVIRSTADETLPLLGRGIGLGASSIIVFRERGGEGWLGGPNRMGLWRLGFGCAFDAMTDKRGGNEFDQTFHRGS